MTLVLLDLFIRKNKSSFPMMITTKEIIIEQVEVFLVNFLLASLPCRFRILRNEWLSSKLRIVFCRRQNNAQSNELNLKLDSVILLLTECEIHSFRLFIFIGRGGETPWETGPRPTIYRSRTECCLTLLRINLFCPQTGNQEFCGCFSKCSSRKGFRADLWNKIVDSVVLS